MVGTVRSSRASKLSRRATRGRPLLRRAGVPSRRRTDWSQFIVTNPKRRNPQSRVHSRRQGGQSRGEPTWPGYSGVRLDSTPLWRDSGLNEARFSPTQADMCNTISPQARSQPEVELWAPVGSRRGRLFASRDALRWLIETVSTAE